MTAEIHERNKKHILYTYYLVLTFLFLYVRNNKMTENDGFTVWVGQLYFTYFIPFNYPCVRNMNTVYMHASNKPMFLFWPFTSLKRFKKNLKHKMLQEYKYRSKWTFIIECLDTMVTLDEHILAVNATVPQIITMKNYLGSFCFSILRCTEKRQINQIKRL